MTERPRWTAAARWWPLLGVLTLLTYNTWVLWRSLNGHEAIMDGYLSELSASDQPHNFFFRGGDLATALIVGALGFQALRVWPRLSSRRRWWMVAASGLILFAVSTLFDAFFSMDCSPTLSAECKVLEQTGRLSAVHYAHSYTSVGAQAGVTTSMIATYIALRRSTWGDVWRLPVLLLCLAEVVPLALLLFMLGAGLSGIGFPQAVTVVVASIWFAVVGVALARQAAPQPPLTESAKEDTHVG